MNQDELIKILEEGFEYIETQRKQEKPTLIERIMKRFGWYRKQAIILVDMSSFRVLNGGLVKHNESLSPIRGRDFAFWDGLEHRSTRETRVESIVV